MASTDNSPDGPTKIKLIVNARPEAAIIYDRPFAKDPSWLEFYLEDRRLEFVMEDGEIKNFSIYVDPDMSKFLQNTYHVLLAQMDENEEGKPVAGGYVPLIIHQD